MIAEIQKTNSSLLEHINIPNTRRRSSFVYNTRIVIKLKDNTDSDDAYALKDLMAQLISKHSTAQVPSTCYVSVQAAPWRKPLHQKGGKAIRILTRHGADRQSFRPEFGPPIRIYRMENGVANRREVLKCDVKANKWEVIDPDALAAMCDGLTKEDCLAELNASEE